MGRARERFLDFAQALRPSFLSRNPHFNFITAHYFWIIGWTIIGSVLIYASAKGQLAYIDALFFASGANTQAGLNTVDANLLNTFQQLVIYFLAMMSNPISIHSSVVFLRLYWFEKRFQHIATEARSRRVSISKSRSKAKANLVDLERGVNGRNITVMHNTAKASRITNDGILLDNYSIEGATSHAPYPNEFPSKDESDPKDRSQSFQRLPPPQIKFSDQVKRSDAIDSDDEEARLPAKRTDAEHIAILERQRNLDKSARRMRIPGPRDADRGVLPEEVDEEGPEGPGLSNRLRRESSVEGHRRPMSSLMQPATRPDRQPTITIEVPIKPHREEHDFPEEIAEDVEATTRTTDALKPRRPRKEGEKLHHTDTAVSTSRINPLYRLKSVITQGKEEDPPYLSWQPTLGRNSAFLGLSEEQREELGGIEYRSLKTLALVLTIYFFGYTFFGIITLVPWIAHNDYYGAIVDAAGQNRVWWGFFTANSAFMDLGLTLTPDSMNSFNTAIFPLLIMSFLIILGNTGFPIMLRFMIWLSSLIIPTGSGLWEELRFLLDHPRRCFTLLFPSNATWWLFFILVALNGIDLILFIILDLHGEEVASLPLNIRFLDGWFQATATRTAGFSCVNLATLHPAVQTSYLIMMYISVFPVAISIRGTNVYEEKSLGVYNTDLDHDDTKQSNISYVGTHLRRQLSFDLWYIFVGYFILTITEGPRLMAGDFSMFAVLFEVVSAYGTVGLSLGYTGINASLCSQFTVLGKLVLIAMQVRGRHRGLPYGLDRAVLLPSEHLNRKEAEEEEYRLQRRHSAMSIGQHSHHRASSLNRGRSRSVERRRLLTGLLHPGPTYPFHHSHSIGKSDGQAGLGTMETLKKHITDPGNGENGDTHEPTPRRRKRADTQPSLGQ
ncbi:potassium transport protein TRK1/TRK2 [Daldinia caldariorum]|uniref:potassium transport protein TRK1/TRK2 n=1 Tax=Daldinia caldariorum TaxID=326644 RepID=UPI002008C2F6|nr:potassium transport protein TRK1/TRK2 [Daldinia caldariorum]KAI1467317.1 potassium transport protein TRK1/TRK2 [Daldinia caldariorum]